VSLIIVNSTGFFWPKAVERLDLADGTAVLGEVTMREAIPDPDAELGTPARYRVQLKQGNRDYYGVDFLWVDEENVRARAIPAEVTVIERREWGNFYGFVKAVKNGAETLGEGTAAVDALKAALPGALELQEKIEDLEKGEVGSVNAKQEAIRLELRGLELDGVTSGEDIESLRAMKAELDAEYERLLATLAELRNQATATAVLAAVNGQEKELALAQLVRVYEPNRMGAFDKVGFYAAKVWEFVADEPREANTEGGIFPAIFGTVMMVIIMSVIVTPLGILAAFYLREYAKQGAFVSAVRIAVNNLAGVPSIVYGVFAVGFFIYLIGGSIDRLFFREALPTPTFGTGGILWASLTLALLTVPVVIVAVEEGLAAIPRGMREASLALGATKFETTWRVVLPAVMPSILTGMILAVARAAGEVAPLMLTGVVKLAPALPLDGSWPFFH
ncbi:MAG: phosphate ABC transporter permease PstA, partial [Candidatus Binatia bacterium]